MPTLREVAKAAGVSTVTASSVLSGANRVRVSDETAERIAAVARSMNYVPRAAARGLRTGRAGAIGFLASPRTHWKPNWQEVLRGMSDLLWDREENLILELPGDERQEEDMLRRLAFGHQVDGIFLQNAAPESTRVRMLEESGLPYVSLGGDPAGNLHVIEFDMIRFGELVVANMLRSAGAIVVLSGRTQSREDREFLQGCQKAAENRRIALQHWAGALLPDPAWIVTARRQSGSKPLGILLTRHLLPELLAMLVQTGLRFEQDIELTYLAGIAEVALPPPGLQVLHLDHYTLGREAVKLMFRLIDDQASAPEPTRHLVLPGIARDLMARSLL